MSEEVLERIYTINLGKVLLSPNNQRAKRAINMIRQFASKHMKSENVKIEEEISHLVWERGIRHPPRKIRVKLTKDEDGNIIVSNYQEEKKIEEKPKKEEKREEKKVEEKPKEKKEGKEEKKIEEKPQKEEKKTEEKVKEKKVEGKPKEKKEEKKAEKKIEEKLKKEERKSTEAKSEKKQKE